MATQVSLHGGETYAYPLYSTQCVVTTDDRLNQSHVLALVECRVSSPVEPTQRHPLKPDFPFFGLIYITSHPLLPPGPLSSLTSLLLLEVTS